MPQTPAKATSPVPEDPRPVAKKPDPVPDEPERRANLDPRFATVLETGDPEAGIWWAGQAQGLIHDVPTVAELVARIVEEARGLVASRLPATLG